LGWPARDRARRPEKTPRARWQGGYDLRAREFRDLDVDDTRVRASPVRRGEGTPDLLKEARGALSEDAPRLIEKSPFRSALEEARAELGLELRDRMGEGRLAEAQVLGGGRDRLQARGGLEGA
jgi:hypothetical protein